MNLAAMATPADYRKLEFLKQSFANTLRELQLGNFPPEARKDVWNILEAASRACMYDGEYSPVVRKYYAFDGDFKTVWFTLDLFTIMPDSWTSKKDLKEAVYIVKQIAALLVGEVRQGLREELRITTIT